MTTNESTNKSTKRSSNKNQAAKNQAAAKRAAAKRAAANQSVKNGNNHRKIVLSIKISSGAILDMPLDMIDFVEFLSGNIPFIEIPTPKVPGVRFVSIKNAE